MGALTRWGLFGDFDFFDSRLGRTVSGFPGDMDLVENENAFTMETNVPGLSKEDIKLELRDDRLIVSGKKETKIDGEKGGEKFIYKGRSSTSFMRSFFLPSKIDTKRIEASVENGVLSIKLPKVKEKVQKIEVK